MNGMEWNVEPVSMEKERNVLTSKCLSCEFVSMLISKRASPCVESIPFGVCDGDGKKERKESFFTSSRFAHRALLSLSRIDCLILNSRPMERKKLEAVPFLVYLHRQRWK